MEKATAAAASMKAICQRRTVRGNTLRTKMAA